jgi:hypothetical protein
MGVSTSHNPVCLHGLLQGYLYLCFMCVCVCVCVCVCARVRVNHNKFATESLSTLLKVLFEGFESHRKLKSRFQLLNEVEA